MIGHICPIHVYCGIGTARHHHNMHARRAAAVRLHLKTPRHGHVVPHHTHRHAEEGTAAVLPCLAQAVHHNARSLISQCNPRPSRRQQRHLAVSHPLCETAHAPQMALCKSGSKRYGGRAGPAVRSRCSEQRRRRRRQQRSGDGS
jgi:hypothetical protein